MLSKAPIFDTDPGYGGDPILNPTQPTPGPMPTPTPAPAPSPSFAGGIFIPTAPPIPRAAPTDLPVPVVAGAPRYSVSDYAAAMRALMPRGRAWSDDPDSAQAKVRTAVATTYARSDAAGSAILNGSIPGRLTASLPEWEATLALPDFNLVPNPSIEQRLDQVRGRFVSVGGQSREAVTAFAAALGFTIAITNYSPFRVGLSTVGNPVASDEWSFVWGVTVTAKTGALPVAVLMSELQAIKPAETTVILLS